MINIDCVSECLKARNDGVRYHVAGVGTFLLRRGGLSAWNRALKEATEEVLGREFSFNEIDPRQNEEITALACCNYLVAGWLDDLKDKSGSSIPYTLTNAKNLLLPEANYSLVELLVRVASHADLFLLANVRREAEELKKS